MKKRGQSKIITIVLLVLLILVLIIILWNIVMGLLKETQYNIGIEQEVSKIKLRVDDANCLDSSGNKIDCTSGNANNISVAIQRSGSGQVIIGHENVTRTRNITITEIIIRPVDIIFVVDTTGSMTDEIADVNATLLNFVNNINENINASNNETNKFGLIDYRDYPVSPCGTPPNLPSPPGYAGDYPSKIHLFGGNKTTDNKIILKSEISNLTINGGADLPESHLTALNDAINNIPERYKKAIILLSDDKPHAQDCEVSPTSCVVNNACYDGDADGKNDTYLSLGIECYTGPKKIESIKQQMIAKNISFYYINKNSGLCYNDKLKQTAEERGKFYFYSETGSATNIDDILISIANDIQVPKTENYTEIVEVIQDEEEWNKLIVRFYNDDGDTCSQTIPSTQVPIKPPKIGETINYDIPLCIEDPTFLRVFFVLPDNSTEKLLTEKCLVPGANQCK